MKRRNIQFLVVENDPDDALLIRLAFSKLEGCGSCFIARNTSEAKAYLRGAGMYADRERFPFPTAVISDLQMSGGTGIELLQEIRGDSHFKDLPVIILTSSASPEETELANQISGIQIAQKPSNIDQLKAFLSKLADSLPPEG